MYIYSNCWEKERIEIKRARKIQDYSAQLEGVANSSASKEADAQKHIVSRVPAASVPAEPTTHRTDGEVAPQYKTAKNAEDGAAKDAEKKSKQLARRKDATLLEKGKEKEKEKEKEKRLSSESTCPLLESNRSKSSKGVHSI